MWWTLPFLVFFVLLALFLFLIFQRTTTTTTSGGGGIRSSPPATSAAPFEASRERPVDEDKMEEAADEEPTPALTPPAAAEATPSVQMKAAEQETEEAIKRDFEQRVKEKMRKQAATTGQVLVVGGVDDLVATYAANEKDDRQRAASAPPEQVASLSGTALVARHLVAADGEATVKGSGDGNVLAAYRHCRGSEGEREPEVGVYYCNEKVDPEHWVKCVVNAWSLHHLLGASIPRIKAVAASVEPSPWGMAMFEAMFPGIVFMATPSADKCAVADQNSLQLWRTEEPATPTFYTVEAALAFKESFYERVQRPPHTRLPGQVTLLVQKHATILNEFDLAYLLAEVSHMPVAIVDLDKLPVLDQVRLMSNTGILVGMHGAGFVNALFLPRGAVTVELFAGRYYSSVYGRYAAPGGVSAYSYHEPEVGSVTSSPQDQVSDLEVSLESFRVVVQKAVQAWRDNNQLYYHHA